MIAIATAALLSPAVIELSGNMTLVAGLVPIVLLIVLIVYMRTRETRNNATARRRNVQPLSAVSAAGTMVDEKPAEPRPAPQPSTVDWAARIKEAEEANDRSLLPGLYLSLARAEIAEGRNEFASEHLRSSVMAAIKARDGATQAEARIELAELARASGDLTTACEHWQIARGLFHKMSEQAKLGDTERLMQQHGCPTDWVLNDF